MKPELVDGQEQKLALRIDKDRVGAVDWTFTRPKSVSVAKLIGGDDRINEVETAAEEKAMRLVEKQARVRVRKSAEKAKIKGWNAPDRETNNLLWVSFRHGVSRSGDPNSHTHVIILNTSYDKAEGVFKAVNLRPVDRKQVEQVYEREMRRGLNRLGYKTEDVGKSWEISGFPAEVKAKFSSRHESIKDMERSYEGRSGRTMGEKAKAKLSLYDKPDKGVDVPMDGRRKGWLSQITDPQFKAVKRLVARAMASVALDRWQAGVKKGYDVFRNRAMRSLSNEREGRTR